jgi:hypothetical protein
MGEATGGIDTITIALEFLEPGEIMNIPCKLSVSLSGCCGIQLNLHDYGGRCARVCIST